MKLLKALSITGIIYLALCIPEWFASAIPADIAWVFFDIFAIGLVSGLATLGFWAIRKWENK